MNKTLLYLIYFAVYSAILLVIGKSSLRDSDSVSKFFMEKEDDPCHSTLPPILTYLPPRCG